MLRRMVSSTQQHQRKRALFWTTTAAAALSARYGTVTAFTLSPASRHTVPSLCNLANQQQDQSRDLWTVSDNNHHSNFPVTSSSSSTRLYSSRRNNNNYYFDDDDDDKNKSMIQRGLDKAKDVAKSFLPNSWFRSKEEKRAAIQRQKVKDEVSGGLQEILKDAPLPIRMLGRAITPIMSNMMSGLADTMAEQQETMQQVLNKAQMALSKDPSAQALLGNGPIQMGTPFSQSSSSTNINGQMSSRVEAAFPVTGTLGNGICRVVAANGEIDALQLEVNGRRISVSTTTTSGNNRRATVSFKSANGDDNIIEAEIIEKETKR